MAVTTLLGLPIPSMSETVGKTIPDLATAMQMIDQKLGGVRIVDHNLDVTNPENGYYARWENGLQLCWHKMNVGQFLGEQNETKSFTWTYPATFSDLARVLASLSYPGGDISHVSRFLIGLIDTSPTNRESVKGYMRDLVGGASITPWASVIAFGRWK